MARFVNESGSVLRSWEHGWTVGPTEELDWPDYDPETHGATPGLRRIDIEPAAAKPKGGRAKNDGDDSGSSGESGSSPDAQAGDNDPASTTSTSAADAAGEENPR